MGLEFKSQIATTREQSEKLLALGLKPGTADMYLEKCRLPEAGDYYLHTLNMNIDAEHWFSSRINRDIIPAWSLSRLLELLPTQIKIGSTSEDIFGLYHENNGEKWNLSYLGIQDFETESPFDSCIAAICWLIGNNKFNKEYLK